jgi:phosphoglycerate dehydrogenase-like enzyme
LLPQADVVVLAVPFTSETEGMIGAEQIAAMKPGALLVNAARGPVVVTDALVAALEAGHIRAAIDVTDPEPLPEGHPLWKAPNLLLTPHVAGSTPKFMVRTMQFAADQVDRYMKGEPLQNVVTGEY